MTLVAMSHGELGRYDTLQRFDRGELRIEDAAELIGMCRRQVYRLLAPHENVDPEMVWREQRTVTGALTLHLLH